MSPNYSSKKTKRKAKHKKQKSKKQKKKSKKETIVKSEFLGGFDYKQIGD